MIFSKDLREQMTAKKRTSQKQKVRETKYTKDNTRANQILKGVPQKDSTPKAAKNDSWAGLQHSDFCLFKVT